MAHKIELYIHDGKMLGGDWSRFEIKVESPYNAQKIRTDVQKLIENYVENINKWPLEIKCVKVAK